MSSFAYEVTRAQFDGRRVGRGRYCVWQRGGAVVSSFLDSETGDVWLTIRRSGSELDDDWSRPSGHTLVSIIAGPDEPEPAAFPVRRLRVRDGLVATRPVRWNRLIVRPDGGAEIELTVGIPEELAEIEFDELDGRLLVTVMLGIEESSVGKAFTAVGIPATADLDLPLRIVDGSRPPASRRFHR